MSADLSTVRAVVCVRMQCGCLSSNGKWQWSELTSGCVWTSAGVCWLCVWEETIRQEFDGDILRASKPSRSREKREKQVSLTKRLRKFWFPLVDKFDSPSDSDLNLLT